MDCSLPGYSVHGIFQARVVEWVAISFSRGSSQPRGSNLGLPHCRQTLYRLSHQEALVSPKIPLFSASLPLLILSHPPGMFFFPFSCVTQNPTPSVLWGFIQKWPLAYGTLLNVIWQPGWEGSLGEDGCMCMCGWVPSLFTCKYHNIVNWLFVVVV